MRRYPLWQVLLVGTGGLAVLLSAGFFLPRFAYPALSTADLQGVTDADRRLELQHARSELQSGFRGQLLQAYGGLFLAAGAIAAWQQIKVAREGQITDRFTRAVEHLGSDKADIRAGGIYALERIAKNSPVDQPPITYLLAVFVRNRAPWPVGTPDGPVHPTPDVGDVPWMINRAPDVQTAMYVLSRRSAHPDEKDVFLSRVDLRAMRLPRGRLDRAHLRHSNLACAWMPDAHLERAQLVDSDLRCANLQRVNLAGADLRRAYLQQADLRGADLRDADLRGANLTGAHIDGANLAGVITDADTVCPDSQIVPLREATAMDLQTQSDGGLLPG